MTKTQTTYGGNIKHSERGAVIVFSAVIVVVFFIVAMLTVDLTMGMTSHEQSENYARLAALSAIEAYFSDTGDSTSKVAAARAAANRIAAGNFILNSGATAQDVGGSGSPVGFDPGTYYFVEEPPGSNPCGDNDGDTVQDTPPCFVSRDPSVAEDAELINAFRVRGELYTSLSTTFAKVLGISEFVAPHVSAVATLVPRHGCFIVDLSPSMVSDTHDPKRVESTSEPMPKYGFLWDTAADKPATGANYLPKVGESQTLQQMWDSLPAIRPGGAVVDPLVHYRDDYKVFTPMSDSDYDAGLHAIHPKPKDGGRDYSNDHFAAPYNIDVFRQPPYQGAEPLSSVLEGLRYAISKFKQRRVSGDQVCIIMFDHDIAWPRVIKLTDDFDAVETFLDFDLDVPVIPPAGAVPPGVQKMLEHGIFPGQVVWTNLLRGIAEAEHQFSQGRTSGVPTSFFITAISDGLTNCSRDFGDCDNSYQYYRQSMDEVLQYAQKKLVPNNLPVHVVMVGEHVAPHTLEIENPAQAGECLSDDEARSLNLDYVMGGDATGSSYRDSNEWQEAWNRMGPFDDSGSITTVPFFQANADMYRLAAMTGGIWAPLRAQEGSCVESATRACDLNNTRRLSDPYCRPLKHQVEDYMADIIGSNPYTLVDVK